MIWLKITRIDFGITIAIICPLVIATPISYFWLRLLEQANKNQQELQEALDKVKLLSGFLAKLRSKQIRTNYPKAERRWSVFTVTK